MRPPPILDNAHRWIGHLFIAAGGVGALLRFLLGEPLLWPLIVGVACAINAAYWWITVTNWRGYTEQFLEREQPTLRRTYGFHIPIEQRRREVRRTSIALFLLTGGLLVLCVAWIVADLLGYEHFT